LKDTNFTIANVLLNITQQFAEVGCDTPRLDAEVLLAHVLGKERTWLYQHPDQPLTTEQQNAFFNMTARRKKREPVAYIVGHKEFFGLDFLLNRHVLVPRPETELLVETAIQIARNNRAQSKIIIADVGTGSGCIAISLAKHLPQVNIFALDISEQALEVARQNADRHHVSHQITFLLGNLLEPLPEPVDIIVSNPPYVNSPVLTAPFTTPEVHQFEPQLALNGGQDGLEVIRELLTKTKELLKSKGSLLVEIGSDQGQKVKMLAKAQFAKADIQIIKDLAGLDRLLVIHT